MTLTTLPFMIILKKKLLIYESTEIKNIDIVHYKCI